MMIELEAAPLGWPLSICIGVYRWYSTFVLVPVKENVPACVGSSILRLTVRAPYIACFLL